MIIIGAAVLALLLVGGTAIALILNRKPVTTNPLPQGSASAGAPQSTAPAPTVTNASDAVKAYLGALAAGQVEVALGLGADQPADKTFLTPEVVAESLTRAPITDINVPAVTDTYSSQVNATYKIGGESVNESFYVRKAGDTFRLSQTTADVNLDYLRSKSLPMYINGVKVTTDKVTLLPGSYKVTSNNTYVDYGTRNILLLKSPRDYASVENLRPALTDKGIDAFTKAVKSALNTCLAQHKLAPAGCPFRTREGAGQKIDQSTIRWKMKGNPLANLKPRLDYQNPAQAEASFSAIFTATARGTLDGRRTNLETGNIYRYVTATVDMNQSPLKVSFDS